MKHFYVSGMYVQDVTEQGIATILKICLDETKWNIRLNCSGHTNSAATLLYTDGILVGLKH
jgi:hypothetical protein